MQHRHEHLRDEKDIQGSITAKTDQIRSEQSYSRNQRQAEEVVLAAFRQRIAAAHEAMRPAREYTSVHGSLMSIPNAIAIQHGIDSLENLATLGIGLL